MSTMSLVEVHVPLTGGLASSLSSRTLDELPKRCTVLVPVRSADAQMALSEFQPLVLASVANCLSTKVDLREADVLALLRLWRWQVQLDGADLAHYERLSIVLDCAPLGCPVKLTMISHPPFFRSAARALNSEPSVDPKRRRGSGGVVLSAQAKDPSVQPLARSDNVAVPRAQSIDPKAERSDDDDYPLTSVDAGPATPLAPAALDFDVASIVSTSSSAVDDRAQRPLLSPVSSFSDLDDSRPATPMALSDQGAVAGGAAEEDVLIASCQVPAHSLLAYQLAGSTRPQVLWSQLQPHIGEELEMTSWASNQSQRMVRLKTADGVAVLHCWLVLTWPFSSHFLSQWSDSQLTEYALSLRDFFRITAVYHKNGGEPGVFHLALRLRSEVVPTSHDGNNVGWVKALQTPDTALKINRLLAAALGQALPRSSLTQSLEPGKPETSTVERVQSEFYSAIEAELSPDTDAERQRCLELSAEFLNAGITLEVLQLRSVQFVLDRLLSLRRHTLRLPHFLTLTLPVGEQVANPGRSLWYNPYTGEFARDDPPRVLVPNTILGLLNHMGTGKTLCAFLFMLLLKELDHTQHGLSVRLGAAAGVLASSSPSPSIVSSGLPHSSAFLVVVTPRILGQWGEQLLKLLQPGKLRCVVLDHMDTVLDDPLTAIPRLHSSSALYRALERSDCDVVLTTFDTLLKYSRANRRKGEDARLDFGRLHFRGLLIDEAQTLRNVVQWRVLTGLLGKMTSGFTLTISGTLWHDHDLANLQAPLQLPALYPFSDEEYWKRTIADPLMAGDTNAAAALHSIFRETTIRFNPRQLIERLFANNGVSVRHYVRQVVPTTLETANTALVDQQNAATKYARVPALQRMRLRLAADNVGLRLLLVSKASSAWIGAGERTRRTQQSVLFIDTGYSSRSQMVTSQEAARDRMATDAQALLLNSIRARITAVHTYAQYLLHLNTPAVAADAFDPSQPVDASGCNDADVVLKAGDLYFTLLPLLAELPHSAVDFGRVRTVTGQCYLRYAQLRPSDTDSARHLAEGLRQSAEGERALTHWRDELVQAIRQQADCCLQSIVTSCGDRLTAQVTALPHLLQQLDGQLSAVKEELHRWYYASMGHCARSAETVWSQSLSTLQTIVSRRRAAVDVARQMAAAEQWTSTAIAELLRSKCHGHDLTPCSPLSNLPFLDTLMAPPESSGVGTGALCLCCQLQAAVQELYNTGVTDHARPALQLLLAVSRASDTPGELTESAIDGSFDGVRNDLSNLRELSLSLGELLRRLKENLLAFDTAADPSNTVGGRAIASIDAAALLTCVEEADDQLKVARRISALVDQADHQEKPSKLRALARLLRELLVAPATTASSSLSSSSSSSSSSCSSSSSSAVDGHGAAELPHVVVFSEFPDMLRLASAFLTGIERFDHASVRVLPDSDSQHYEPILSRFLDPRQGLRVLLCSLRQGSEGLNLPVATSVVFLEGSSSWSVRWQGLYRIVRLGRKDVRLRSYTLVAAGTVDEDMHYDNSGSDGWGFSELPAA